jgi:hypothetical protein
LLEANSKYFFAIPAEKCAAGSLRDLGREFITGGHF